MKNEEVKLSLFADGMTQKTLKTPLKNCWR